MRQREQILEQLETDDALRKRVPLETREPDEELSLAVDDVALGHRPAENGVAVHERELARVDHSMLDRSALADGGVDPLDGFPHRQRIDEAVEEANTGWRGRRTARLKAG